MSRSLALPELVEAPPADDPFRYGTRFSRRRRPDGSYELLRLPLTLWDLLHPQMDDKIVQALVLTGVWLVVVVGVRFACRFAFNRYERQLAEKDPAVAARRRTTFSFLLRIVIALIVLIGLWSVLSIFTVTQEVARAFLASSAVLAVMGWKQTLSSQA